MHDECKYMRPYKIFMIFMLFNADLQSYLPKKKTAIYYLPSFQAFLEHGIPESPEMVVALMQKVWPRGENIYSEMSNLFWTKIYNVRSTADNDL